MTHATIREMHRLFFLRFLDLGGQDLSKAKTDLETKISLYCYRMKISMALVHNKNHAEKKGGQSFQKHFGLRSPVIQKKKKKKL